MSSFSSLSFLTLSETLRGQSLVFATIFLFICSFTEISRNKYFIKLLLYFIVVFISVVYIQKRPLSTVCSWCAPLTIYFSLSDREYKYIKPIYWFFIIFFIANTGISIFERITGERLLEVDYNNEILVQQMNISEEEGDTSFRSFSLLGHPLTNANIMAFMAFIIFYTKSSISKYKLPLLILGTISLFCFNARAAIVITIILLIPTIKKTIEDNRKHKLFSIIIIIILFTTAIIHFSSFEGRLGEGFADESSLVRLTAIQYFFSIPLYNLIIGGNKIVAGENGILMILEQFGLILGGLKIYLEVLFAYTFLKDNLKNGKWTIILSLFLIGTCNNNLYYPLVYPFFILSLVFIVKYSNIIYKNEDII